MTRSAMRLSSMHLASRSLLSQRPWITTFATPSTASASRRRSPAPPMLSSASGPRLPRTSGSAFSASSAAMPALRRSTRRTPPRSAVSSPNTRSISTSSSGCSSRRSAQTPATMRWFCSARAPSGRAIKCANMANPMRTGTVRRQASPSRWPTRSSGAPARRP